jgi:hypothetical protein
MVDAPPPVHFEPVHFEPVHFAPIHFAPIRAEPGQSRRRWLMPSPCTVGRQGIDAARAARSTRQRAPAPGVFKTGPGRQ